MHTFITGDGDDEQDVDYIGDPTTMHHTHPEDMPLWIKNVIITSKVLLSGPFAVLLLCGNGDDGENNENDALMVAVADKADILSPRDVVHKLVMMRVVKQGEEKEEKENHAIMVQYNQDEASMAGLDIVRSMSLLTLTQVARHYDLETRLVELQRCSSIEHYNNIGLQQQEMEEMPGIACVQRALQKGIANKVAALSPATTATPSRTATTPTHAPATNTVGSTTHGEVVVDAVTVRRDEMLSCLRGNLSFVKGMFKATPTTTSGWSEPTPVQTLNMPTSIITQVAQETAPPPPPSPPSPPSPSSTPLPSTSSFNAANAMHNLYATCRSMSQEERVHTLSCQIVNRLKEQLNQKKEETTVGELHLRTLGADGSKTSMAVARHVVRQGLERLHLYGGDPTFAVVTLSSLIDTASTPDIDWYIGTLVLAAGCAHKDRRILVDPCIGDMLSASSSFATERLYSFDWSIRVAQRVGELLECQGSDSVVRAAFKMEGISLAFVVHRWLSQCFWNYLPFDVVLVYLVGRLEVWGGGENGKGGSALDLAETSYFVAAVLEHIVTHYMRESSLRRPTVSLRDILVDGPFPASLGVSVWKDRVIWDCIEAWRRKSQMTYMTIK